MKYNRHNSVFIDGNNLHLTMINLGWALDYKRFRIYIEEKYYATNAYYFIGKVPGNEQLYNGLSSYGYNLVFKETLFVSCKGYKGNCDAELVLEAMKRLDEYDKAVIVSSDGDFRCLVDHLLSLGKLERVLAPCRSGCSILLRKAAGAKMDYLDNLRGKLEYKGKEAPHEDETS